MGEHAVRIAASSAADALAARDALRSALPGADLVVGARSLLVLLPAGTALSAALGVVRAVLAGGAPEAPGGRTPAGDRSGRHLFDVRYDGADLDAVAAATGLPRAEVVARHTAADYRVDLVGFVPGFPYLSGTDPALHLPRRPTPRPAVPAGSVAVAAGMTCVYPSASPGGWWLLGRTDARLFDPRRDPPALLVPGDRVRLRAADRPSPPAAGPAAVEPPGVGPPAGVGSETFEVLDPGPATTVQDLGRPGYAAAGVPRSGALDARSLVAANRAVGNPDGAAGLECTLLGPALRALRPVVVALAGADAPRAVVVPAHGGPTRPVPRGVAVPLGPGDVLRVGALRGGARAYVAVAGGLAGEPVLGSLSVDTLSGLGGARLAGGATLGTPSPAAGLRRGWTDPGPAAPCVRLLPGPDLPLLGAAAWDALLAGAWRVGPASNRVGVRLDGPPLRDVPGSLPPAGMVDGAVQVTAEGLPVVLLADHGTTGGYPVAAVVVAADLVTLAQARPGAAVRFVSR